MSKEGMKMTEKELLDLANEKNWTWLSEHPILPEEFMDKHIDKLHIFTMCIHQKLSEKFILKHFDKLSIFTILRNQYLSEEFMEEHFDKFDKHSIYCISEHQKISEIIIEKHFDEFYEHLNFICCNQYLSEKYIDKLIEKRFDILHMSSIYKNQKLSLKLIEKHKDIIDVEIQLKKHHDKRTLEDKYNEVKNYAEKYDLEYDKEYLYAYRNHDMYGRGEWNKTRFYKKGIYYRDWRCDLDKNDGCSFGLGIWPKGNTKVKVKIEDWGVNMGKSDSRVWAFRVL